MAKYIFVTGGVVSSLGKGIAAASIGCLLESRGLKVTCQKFDPYLNVDPGTMSPFLHVTLVPWIAAAHEMKTKPTQHSVKELRAIGIQPDILICRSERFIPPEMKEKIALFCDVDVEAVVTARDVKSVYEVPVEFAAEGVDDIVLRLLRYDAPPPRDLSRWKE